MLPLTGHAACEGHGYAQELPREPQSAAIARRFVSDALRAWRLDDVDLDNAAGLVVTELVANAVTHVDRGPIRVSICHRPTTRRVRIAVADHSDAVPLLRAADRDAETGRGLHMVNELSGGRWGTDLPAVGKRVRADLRVGKIDTPATSNGSIAV
ncbi:ATP-binding protein [Embleya sp. AB8]|uniref:ATP-binding protein n=1 Tax=Embleya sp. AB8 TaxID=3156304 RepID=UPI003C713FFA